MNPALWLLQHSVGVFPIKPHDKVPACKSWDDHQATEAEVVTWQNYGVVLGVLAVVDTDNPDDEHWAQQYVIDTPFRVTTARGLHRYYRQHAPSPKYIHRDGHVIEHRNSGQYVVGPGSTHPSGLVYRAQDWSWRWSDIPFFPDSFEYDDRPFAERSSEDGAPYKLPPVIKAGERHDEMFKLCRSLMARGVPLQAALDACYAVNLTNCVPPLDKQILYKFLRRVEHHQDRHGFQRPSVPFSGDAQQAGWDLAGGLLEIELPVDRVLTIVRSVVPAFDPERTDD